MCVNEYCYVLIGVDGNITLNKASTCNVGFKQQCMTASNNNFTCKCFDMHLCQQLLSLMAYIDYCFQLKPIDTRIDMYTDINMFSNYMYVFELV